MNEKGFKEFTEKFPEIANLLKNPEKLLENDILKDKIKNENWQDVALLILSSLWKFKGANVFHQPVNPEKLGKK